MLVFRKRKRKSQGITSQSLSMHKQFAEYLEDKKWVKTTWIYYEEIIKQI